MGLFVDLPSWLQKTWGIDPILHTFARRIWDAKVAAEISPFFCGGWEGKIEVFFFFGGGGWKGKIIGWSGLCNLRGRLLAEKVEIAVLTPLVDAIFLPDIWSVGSNPDDFLLLGRTKSK